jgi:hypothetical protein
LPGVALTVTGLGLKTITSVAFIATAQKPNTKKQATIASLLFTMLLFFLCFISGDSPGISSYILAKIFL